MHYYLYSIADKSKDALAMWLVSSPQPINLDENAQRAETDDLSVVGIDALDDVQVQEIRNQLVMIARNMNKGDSELTE